MKISVAICTFNGAKFIEKQLLSILNQTLKVDEIILCDDCSSDTTIEIIDKINNEFFNKITIYQNESNLKSNKNFEKAITLCSGDYIFCSDQDDVWSADKVEKIMQKFSENKELEVVFTNANLIDDNGDSIENQNLWNSVAFFETVISDKKDLQTLLHHKSNMVTGATMCLKKSIVPKILPIPILEKLYHDEWIAFIAAQDNKLDFIPEHLISYRIHVNQQTGEGIVFKKNKINENYLLSKQVLGLEAPKSYLEIKKLSNNYHRNYARQKEYSIEIDHELAINFKELAEKNLDLFLETENKIKIKYPLLSYFRTKADAYKGKRKI